MFKANCTGCHGADLQGRMGPSSSLVKAGARRSAEQIAEQIANGGGGMLPFKDKLTKEEIRSLAEWLSELR
ncbi:cytochrome c [Paenibacillus sp. CC-CFT747]|nr:cytochrome c [Paenibacillus sp. CC-CFT747]